MSNFQKINFFRFKCTLGIQKLSAEGLVPRNIFYQSDSLLS